ncbi:uracil phosphoribosyltransferase homolog isoform X1 [Pipra filicauda]|uniref:Uracil phosphoribosyltransferase homolog isoform X1 n=1 Tax=Pipra filicauda TaxID=649802 RepID=A0A7R5KZE0_9PASS|nr:uracil phosphoribosyltransferase homolog isoform X1 [Pipra filicauda]
MEAMPCQNQRLGPRPQEEPPPAATATAGGGSRLIRFAEPSEDSGCPSPDSSSSSSNGVVAAPPVPAGEGGAPAIGPQLKLLPMNDQLRELQTIIRDKKSSRGDFVFSADRLIRLVVEEGLNQLPYTECTVTTPTGHKYEGVRFEKGNCGVSIMRSGEAMEQGLRDCCRSIRIGKILIQSDEETQRAKVYYAKFPPDIYRRKVLLMYPILSDRAGNYQAVPGHTSVSCTSGNAKQILWPWRCLEERLKIKTWHWEHCHRGCQGAGGTRGPAQCHHPAQPVLHTPRCQIHHPGIPRNHHFNYRSASCCTNTLWTEVFWNRLTISEQLDVTL